MNKPCRASARRSIRMLATLFLLAPAAGCQLPEEEEVTEGEEAIESPLLGKVTYFQPLPGPAGPGGNPVGCRSPKNLVPLLDRAMFLGRVASVTEAFKECIFNLHVGMPGYTQAYQQCPGDPDFGADQRTQMYRLLTRTRNFDPTFIYCSGGRKDANASASLLGTDHRTHVLKFNYSWLSRVASLPSPAADPTWPAWQVADTIWHEVMHNYNYVHDNCGYAPGVDFQEVSAPYIVGNCIRHVISESGKKCPLDSCGPGSLSMLTSLNGSECRCVRDPR